MGLPSVNQFKERMALGGARANYYIVNGPTIGADMAYLARGASLPAANVNQVEVMTPGGRKLKFAGERTFEDWTVSVYNDTAMITRKKFEKWQRACADYGNPLGADALGAYGVSNWSVTQLSRTGLPVRSYNFYNMWPAGLGAIELSFDEASNIEQFDVTFAFSHYEPAGLSSIPVQLTRILGDALIGGGDLSSAATNLSAAIDGIISGAGAFSPEISSPPTQNGK